MYASQSNLDCKGIFLKRCHSKINAKKHYDRTQTTAVFTHSKHFINRVLSNNGDSRQHQHPSRWFAVEEAPSLPPLQPRDR